MKTIASLSVASLVFVSGCALPTTPVSVAPRGGTSPTQIAVMAGGAVAGAALGNELGGDKGALIGAGAGALIGGVANSMSNTWYRKTVAEAKEEGRREAAIEAQERAWEAATQAAQNQSASTERNARGPKMISIEYPSGTYEGVNYGPRTVTVPTPRQQ